MRKYVFVLGTVFLVLVSSSLAFNEHHHNKKATQKSYVCPPHFMRLSYKCYFFSNTTATWQEAYWKCRDMKSNIATIKNSNQDKIIRRTLDHEALVPLERWIGGRYDWGTMSWKWAASGKEIQFHGMEETLPTKRDALDWHCIILDPKKHYRWSSRSCTEPKHYVCQTKLRKVDQKEKKRIQKEYRNKLNEVAVPDIATNSVAAAPNKTHGIFGSYYDNNELDNNAAAYRPRELRLRKKNKKEISRYEHQHQRDLINDKALRNRQHRDRNNNHKKHRGHEHNPKRTMRYMTYYEATKNPLLPRVAVEDFKYTK